MTVQLSTLVGSVKARLNPLGGPEVVALDNTMNSLVIAKLADAFWTAKSTLGYFPNHRVNVAGTAIEPIGDDIDDLGRDEQQVIVLMLVMAELQTKIANTPNRRRAKAGPNEVERETSASVLTKLLDQNWALLEKLEDRIREEGNGSSIGVLDLPAMAAACGRTFIL